MDNAGKSFRSSDPLIRYVADLSVKWDPLQAELHQATIDKSGSCSRMLGAPEVLQLGQNLIRLTAAKRALDIGTFTGASAAAWSIALPADGEVLTMDVSHSNLDELNCYIRQKEARRAKIMERQLKKLPMKKTSPVFILLFNLLLICSDSLIASGESGKWDFAFIDADKANYSAYYEKCVELLRSGGVIVMDNALWSRTAHAPEDECGRHIDEANRRISADPRTMNSLLLLGDGTHLAFKI